MTCGVGFKNVFDYLISNQKWDAITSMKNLSKLDKQYSPGMAAHFKNFWTYIATMNFLNKKEIILFSLLNIVILRCKYV